MVQNRQKCVSFLGLFSKSIFPRIIGLSSPLTPLCSPLTPLCFTPFTNDKTTSTNQGQSGSYNKSQNWSKIAAELFLAIFLSNYGVNQLYKCLKNNENTKNLNSSLVKASDMVPEVYAQVRFPQSCCWQFFFLILE